MTLGGYHGRYLLVDLTTGEAAEHALPVRDLRRFLGGSGLGTFLLQRHTPAGVDPLGPEAAVVFALSPLVGTPLTTSAKFAVVSKSPLTGRINDALSSDRFAIEMKRAGFDAVVITGVAPAWSLLVIDPEGARILPVPDLVGCSSAAAEARLAESYGKRHRFFGIGVAGERQVHFATVSGDGRHAGRGGTGAVFGSKRLKGVLAHGTGAIPLANPAAVLEIAKDLSKRSLGAGTAKYRELGTIANVLVQNRLGALPTRNFQTGTFEGAEAISGEAFHATPGRVRKHCAACTIGCEHVFRSAKGISVRLEYEGVFALGPLLGIDDREAVLEAAAACDEWGLDVISAGGTLAFAMECTERGLLPNGPAFGDGPGVLRMLKAIAHREGLGKMLADGSRAAAAHIGQGAEAFACHVKGLELPGYEPRALQAMALGLAVGSRGADHNRSGAYEEDFRAGANRLAATDDKGPAAAASETRAALLDSLILCKFLRGIFDDLDAEAAAMLGAVTGWDVSARELQETGARIVTLKKLFNIREGWTRAEDTLPRRFLEEPLETGASKGAALSAHDLARMIQGYYAARGWTEMGAVPEQQLMALDLEDLTDLPRTPGATPA